MYLDFERGRTERPSYVCRLYRGDSNDYFCVGTLVSPTWVLISTSCLSSEAGNLANSDLIVVCPATPQDANPAERVSSPVWLSQEDSVFVVSGFQNG